ncbi:IclR family transcriptional regulator domain-containing protein [Streptomyces halstedii]|uniref:IclR family transcriptional regulator domain-containing protein n=1 Tax=Streptomyces halstedii TaxID=1944 RepID=UPI00365D305B
MTEERTAKKPVENVNSLERGLAVIRAFDAEHHAMTLSDMARRVDLPRATTRRLLHTLVNLGYVSTNGRTFALTARTLELGYSYLSGSTLRQISLPHLEQLTGQVHESSSVSVLDGPDIVYVAKIPTRRIISVVISIGTRLPAYATSMGRVLLAGLDEAEFDAYLESTELAPRTARTVTDVSAFRAEIDKVREQGWALVDQELELDLRSIAAPLRDRRGRVIAAINMSTSTRHHDVEDVLHNLLPELLRSSERIDHDLRVSSADGPWAF